MIDLTGVEHHPAVVEMVDVLCAKTQNTDRGFFNAEVAYFLAKMASSMRATIVTKDRGEIPVNLYVLALGTSGYGKGHSVAIVEGEYLAGFKKRFMEDTFPVIAEQHLYSLAAERALRNGTDPQVEFEAADAEFRRCGALPFTFDSGTTPAIKQLRQKLMLGNVGAINLQIDEIGSNMIANIEIMNVYLELFDQGMVKQKLTKNTSDSVRGEELDGKTPTNALLFGTPAKLLDGGQTEDQFYSFLDTGYARRCIFGWGQQTEKAYNTLTPAEIYANLIRPGNVASVDKWANHFHKLADPSVYGWKMIVEDAVGIQLLTYKIECEKAAETMPDHEEIRKAELSHRYFKALKLAGTYAFIDGSIEIEMDHLMSAILLIEESGAAFQAILNREKAYVKLAKYIAAEGTDLTHADLHEALPFFKGSNAFRNDMMIMAIGWAYGHHIIIKKTFRDNLEFFKGEKLEETNLDKMIVAYSDHWAYNYNCEEVPFDQLTTLTQAPGMHWTNHHFKDGHRLREKVLPGFNMISIDVDGGTTLTVAHELLKDYKFLTYTTKRHNQVEGVDGDGNDILGPDRFRIMIPMNYTLRLDPKEYKEFMDNVMAWLPFTTDESANEPEKKWETFDGGQCHYNMDGELLDVLEFIPRTSKNDQFKQNFQKVESLDNLERWFAGKIATGSRNNQMIKFALALVDSGLPLMDVNRQVHAFNQKLANPLPTDEIDVTIMQTVAKRYTRS